MQEHEFPTVNHTRDLVTRREVLRSLGLMASGALVPEWITPADGGVAREPRLQSRPGAPNEDPSPAGTHEFTIPASRAVVHAPASVKRDVAAPLVVFLHGARRSVDFFVEAHRAGAEAAGVIVLAPYSKIGTWDAIRSGEFADDVAIIDAALAWTFRRWTIDPARIVMSGFSDGGTYALAIGRANGDLFSKIVAYAPGFAIPVTAVKRPSILITHGTRDRVLPIDATSRVIVPSLRAGGYSVDYRELDADHTVPMAVVNELLSSLAGARR
jgi:phospholipase/carboxylesterase